MTWDVNLRLLRPFESWVECVKMDLIVCNTLQGRVVRHCLRTCVMYDALEK